MKRHLLSRPLLVSALFVLLLSACSYQPGDLAKHGAEQWVIYRAGNIITSNPDQPFAEAVVTRGDRIMGVGGFESLSQRFSDQALVVDDSFADKTIMAGFVDPHIHPTLAAIILSMDIVAAMEWPTVNGSSIAVQTPEGFLARLRELDQQTTDQWLTVWGYHAPYHGPLSREILDGISTNRPILVWQRSVHEMYFNSKALEELGLTEAMFAASDHADWQQGHLWESALFTIGKPATKLLASPLRYLQGLATMSNIIHRGGLTTVGEQGFPQVNEALEYWTLWWELDRDSPYRFALVPNAMFLLAREGSVEGAEQAAAAILQRGNSHIITRKHMKYYADGAIFSQLMQMSEPYLDGHHGAWMMPVEQQQQLLTTFWDRGWDIHIHVNGDAGLDRVLDDVEVLRQQSALSTRVVLEHYGYAREEQHQRVKALDVAVSNNAYYLHELAPIYAEHGLGKERAQDISPLGALAAADVPISFHSDYPMAPAKPLTQVWVAVNRIASDGKVWGRHQRLALDKALAAITLEGAKSLGMEADIGSIAVGKKADFTILEQDPYQVDPVTLKDIAIWGTVYEGAHYPL